jgi:hypothetical protein
MSYPLGWTTCPECGVAFHRDAPWKRTCIGCWKSKKRSENSSFAPSQHSDYWREQYYALQGRFDGLQDRFDDLQADFWELHRVAHAVLPNLKENIPALITLVHPDRHDNSQISNRVTSWLLDARRILQ